MIYPEINRFIKQLATYKGRVPTQQLRTLRGQALAGDLEGAMKGLGRLCDVKQARHAYTKNTEVNL